MKTETKMSQWISVEDERKPEYDEEVLLIIDRGRSNLYQEGEHPRYIVKIGWYDKDEGWVNGREPNPHFVYECDPGFGGCDIYWMPIPEFPEEIRNG